MTNQASGLTDRMISIDVLRGLAMFLIIGGTGDIGGAPVGPAFTTLFGENFAKAAAIQFSYPFTEGLLLSFIAMPMFLFVVGLVIPFSMRRRVVQTNNNKKLIYRDIIKRSLILFLFGLIAGGHLLRFEWAHLEIYNNVLEYIAIGYLISAILVLNTSIKVQLFITIGLLLLYWLLFVFIPVPGWDGETYSGKMNLAIFVDNSVMGPFHRPGSGRLLSTITLVANMLIGVLVGHMIFSDRKKEEKTKMLFIYGFGMLVIGIIWGLFYPVIRTLWTGSYVLETCGITTLVLAIFYYLNDVKGYTRWSFFFFVLGVNSITVYMMAHLFDFRLIGNIFVGGFARFVPPNFQNFIEAVAAQAIIWLILLAMYRKKIFLKV